MGRLMIASSTNQIIYPLLPFLQSQLDISNKLMEFLSEKEIGRFCSTCRTVVNMSQHLWRHYFFQVLHGDNEILEDCIDCKDTVVLGLYNELRGTQTCVDI